jgi:hypothetical protein
MQMVVAMLAAFALFTVFGFLLGMVVGRWLAGMSETEEEGHAHTETAGNLSAARGKGLAGVLQS